MTEPKGKKPVEKIRDSAHQVADAAAAPAPVRHYRATLFQLGLLVIIVAFAILTFLVKTTPSFATDVLITKGIQQISIPLFYELMVVISWPGFDPQSLIITVLIVLMIYGFGLHWEAVMALAAAVVSTAVNVLVKDFIQRPRPTTAVVHVLDTLNSYSFPSGHVMFYLGFYGFVWFLAFSLLKPSFKRGLLLVFFGSLVLLIGFSRIYVGEHWASDVLGSYLLGTLVLVALIHFYRMGKKRFFIRQPVAAAAAWIR